MYSCLRTRELLLLSFWHRNFFLIFFYVRHSILPYLEPLKFHCVGGRWDRTQDCWHWQPDDLTTGLDLIHKPRSHPQTGSHSWQVHEWFLLILNYNILKKNTGCWLEGEGYFTTSRIHTVKKWKYFKQNLKKLELIINVQHDQLKLACFLARRGH